MGIIQGEEPPRFLAFVQTDVPEGAGLQKDGTILFRQQRTLFRQTIYKNVIGLIYMGPKTAGWTSIDLPNARARLKMYQRRAEGGEVSEAVAGGLDMWEWAVLRFAKNEHSARENMETIQYEGFRQ